MRYIARCCAVRFLGDTGYVKDLKLVTLFQEEHFVEKHGWGISDAEAFVVQTVGDVVPKGLAEDTVRQPVTPRSTELAVVIP